MENFDGFRHTEFKSWPLAVTAADYAIPQPSDISGLGPSIDVVQLKADELDLAGAIGNVGNIFVELTGTATPASLILRPGDHQKVSGAGKTTLSAIALNVNDALEIIALYR